MKKITLLFVFLIAMILESNAQITLRFGVEAGANLSKHQAKLEGEKFSSNKLGLGLKGGVLLDLGIGSAFSIQPGIYFNRITQNLDSDLTIEVNNEIVSHTRIEGSQFTNAVTIPIGLQFYFGEESKFFVGLGPQFDYFLSGKEKYVVKDVLDNSKTIEDVNEKLEFEDDDIRMNISAMVNAGFMHASGFFVRASYSHGLSNLFPEGDKDNLSKINQLGISIGILFGGKK